MNNTRSKSYAPLILCGFFVLILSGWWSYYLINKIDYDNNTFKVIESEQFNLEDLQGYVVYIDFWAAWCKPCRDSFPWMQRMREKYADSALRIVAVNLDQKAEDMQAFLDQHPVDFTIVTDASYTLFRQFDIKGVPTSIVIDRDGIEISRHAGFHIRDQDTYEQQIRQALQSLETVSNN